MDSTVSGKEIGKASEEVSDFIYISASSLDFKLFKVRVHSLFIFAFLRVQCTVGTR